MRKLVASTIAIWIAAFAAAVVLPSYAVMHGPRDGDEYAYRWSFQIFARTVVYAPWFLGALAIVLLLLGYVLHAHAKRRPA